VSTYIQVALYSDFPYHNPTVIFESFTTASELVATLWEAVDMHSQALFPKVQQITEVSPIMITTLQM
jgi:hypothetical protein